MTLTLTPLTPGFVAEVSGIDISQPLAPAQVRAIEKAMDDYGVLVFRKQPMTQDQQIRYAKYFGPLDLGLRRVKGGPHRFDYAERRELRRATTEEVQAMA